MSQPAGTLLGTLPGGHQGQAPEARRQAGRLDGGAEAAPPRAAPAAVGAAVLGSPRVRPHRGMPGAQRKPTDDADAGGWKVKQEPRQLGQRSPTAHCSPDRTHDAATRRGDDVTRRAVLVC